jgi:hypothetical protein
VTLFSARHIPLVLQDAPPAEGLPRVTVENYLKWYHLYVVHPGGAVEAIDFPDDRDARSGESAFVDHVPNPIAVVRMAKRLGYQVCSESYEMMVGRWVTEATGAFRSLPDAEAEVLPPPPPWGEPLPPAPSIQTRIVADVIAAIDAERDRTTRPLG